MIHTPGPWEIIETEYKRETRTEILRQGHSEPVARVYHKGTCNNYHYTMPQEANAALIAAAPDLLAACQAISDAFVNGDIVWKHKRQSDSDPYHPANTKLCAAIAKARGKE